MLWCPTPLRLHCDGGNVSHGKLKLSSLWVHWKVTMFVRPQATAWIMMSISILPETGVMPGTSVQLSVAVASVMFTPAGAAGAEGVEQLSTNTDVSCVSMSRTAD